MTSDQGDRNLLDRLLGKPDRPDQADERLRPGTDDLGPGDVPDDGPNAARHRGTEDLGPGDVPDDGLHPAERVARPRDTGPGDPTTEPPPGGPPTDPPTEPPTGPPTEPPTEPPPGPLRDPERGEAPRHGDRGPATASQPGDTVLAPRPEVPGRGTGSEVRAPGVPDHRRPGDEGGTGLPSEHDGALVPPQDAARHRERWDAIQTSFVDDPRAAVRAADALAGEVADDLARHLARRREALGAALREESTEGLRLALNRYRAFVDRLLAV